MGPSMPIGGVDAARIGVSRILAGISCPARTRTWEE